MTCAGRALRREDSGPSKELIERRHRLLERNHLDAALVPARPTEVIAGAGDSGYERPFSGQGDIAPELGRSRTPTSVGRAPCSRRRPRTRARAGARRGGRARSPARRGRARRGPRRAHPRRPARGRPAATPARRGAPRDRGGSPCGRSTYTRAGVPSGAATSRTAARTGAESSRTAVAPPCAGVTSKRRSSAASPRAATRTHAPNGTVHHRRPLATAGKDREAGGGNQGQPKRTR